MLPMMPPEPTAKQLEESEEDFQNYCYTHLQWGKGGEDMSKETFDQMLAEFRIVWLMGNNRANNRRRSARI